MIDGVYTLHDLTDSIPTSNNDGVEEDNDDTAHLLRMPPSLTLSKIRNIKEQALYAGVKADLEISTVALSCIYFERLALGKSFLMNPFTFHINKYDRLSSG